MSSVVQPGTVLLTSAALREHCEALMRALGVSAHDAQQTVDVFLQAELMGEQSHGLRLFLQVLSRLKAGGDRAATEIEVVMDRGAVALRDARRSLGQVTAARAMERAIEKARSHGIGYVAVRNGNSFTSAKHYPLMAAGVGMIGCAFTNTSRKLMPPPGGVTPVLGNNPVAYGARWSLRHLRTRHGLHGRCGRAHCASQGTGRGDSVWVGARSARQRHERSRQGSRVARFASIRRIQGFRLGYGARDRHQRAGGGHLFAGGSKGFAPYDQPMNTSFSLLAIDITAFQPRCLRGNDGADDRHHQDITAARSGGPDPLPRRALPRRTAPASSRGIPLPRSTSTPSTHGARSWGLVPCARPEAISPISEVPGAQYLIRVNGMLYSPSAPREAAC